MIIIFTESDDVSNEKSEAMPCGRVVGVLQRNWRDYVASLPDDLEVIVRGKAGVSINSYRVR